LKAGVILFVNNINDEQKCLHTQTHIPIQYIGTHNNDLKYLLVY